MGDIREFAARSLRRLRRRSMQDIDQRAAGVANRRQPFLQTAAAVVFDDETGAGGDVSFEVGIDAPGVPGAYGNPGIVESPDEGPTFDQKIDLKAGQQHRVERTDDELVLANSEDAHVRGASKTWPNDNYTPLPR